MEATDQMTLRPAMPSGMGCALVFPAALFGTLMLTDYAGPPVWWRALAEFIGWWTICIAASVGCEALFARYRARLRGRYWYLLASILVASALLALMIAEVQPNTPLQVKLFFTTGLQFVGFGGALALAGFIGWVALASRRA
jgi:hypothetical protein